VPHEIRIESRAHADIVELATYIGRDSAVAANRFLEAVRATFAILARQPLLGARYETKNPRLTGVRIFRVKKFPNHLVFYIARQDDIRIVRVLHGARDLDVALKT